MKFIQKLIAGLASLALAFPIITASTTPVKAGSLDIPDGAEYTIALSEWNNDYVLLNIHALGPADGNAGNSACMLSTCGAMVVEERPQMTILNQGHYYHADDEQGLAYVAFYPLHQNAKCFFSFKVAKSDLVNGKTLNCEAVFYTPTDVDTEDAYIMTADDYDEFSGYIRAKGNPISFSVTLGEPLKSFTSSGMTSGNVSVETSQDSKEEVKKDDSKKETEKKETAPTPTPEVKETSVPETPTPTEETTKEESKQSNNSMIWIGCGIVVVIIAGVVISKKKM